MTTYTQQQLESIASPTVRYCEWEGGEAKTYNAANGNVFSLRFNRDTGKFGVRIDFYAPKRIRGVACGFGFEAGQEVSIHMAEYIDQALSQEEAR